MANYLTFLILGLGAGAVYAGIAMSVLTVYKATGVVNFAQGAMAAWGAYVAVELTASGRMVFPIGTIDLGAPQAVGFSLVIGLLHGVALSGLSYILIFYPLRKAPVLAQVVASIGLMLTMQALVVLRFGAAAPTVQPIFAEQSIELGSIKFSSQVLVMLVLILIIGAALAAFFRFTRFGLAIRASSEDEQAAVITGYSPARLASFAWMSSGFISTLVVMIAAPATGLNPTIFTLFIVPALGAVLVGRFNSIGITCAAALSIGAAQSVITYGTTQSWWPHWAQSGIATTLPFIVIVVLLYFSGDRVPLRGSLLAAKMAPVFTPRARPLTVIAWIAIAVIALFVLSGSYRFGLITSMILAVLSLSLVVLTGYLGQISLAQAAIAGTAGFLLSRLGAWWGGLFPLDIIVASLAAAAVGVLVAIPALRMRGTQLAIVTMAAAVAVEAFIFSNPQFTPRGGNPIVSPSIFGWDLGIRSGTNVARIEFGLLVLAVLVIVSLALVRILSGDTGRAFLAVRSNEKAAAAIGINVPLTKVLGFGLSAFIAGLGGCLLGYSRGQLSVDSFTVFVGVSLLAFAYLGGITSIAGAIVAGLLGPLGLVYVFLDNAISLGTYYSIVSGLGLVITSVLNPYGIAGAFDVMLRRLRGPTKASATENKSAPTAGTERQKAGSHV